MKSSEKLMTPDIKKQIALKIGLSELDIAGITIIRDDRGFRINEKDIEYFWILSYNHLNGLDNYGLFTIKFKESNFREFKNPKEMIPGIFNLDNDKIDIIHFESSTLNFDDQIATKFNELDFFYSENMIENEIPSIIKFLIESKNISANIESQYIKNKKWTDWNDEIIKVSKSISKKSKNSILQKIAEV